jgi:hypothetical protein
VYVSLLKYIRIKPFLQTTRWVRLTVTRPNGAFERWIPNVRSALQPCHFLTAVWRLKLLPSIWSREKVPRLLSSWDFLDTWMIHLRMLVPVSCIRLNFLFLKLAPSILGWYRCSETATSTPNTVEMNVVLSLPNPIASTWRCIWFRCLQCGYPFHCLSPLLPRVLCHPWHSLVFSAFHPCFCSSSKYMFQLRFLHFRYG